MDNFISTNTKYSRTQDLVIGGVYQDFHKSIGLAAFTRAAHPLHRHFTDQDILARIPGLLLRHADSSQRRIDKQSITQNAIRHPARIVVEQVRSDDFVIIPGRMGECPPAIRVAHGPDARNVSGQLIIHFYKTARIRFYSRGIQAQVLSRRRS